MKRRIGSFKSERNTIKKLLDIQYEVQQAYAELNESEQALKLFTEKLIPISEQNVSAARSNYDVGKSSFLDLAIAQRQLIDMRNKYQEALAEYHRRVAAMERAYWWPFTRFATCRGSARTVASKLNRTPRILSCIG